MSDRQHLRVGLAGAGMISLYHLRGWAETNGAQVVAVCDTDRERATQRAAEFGIEQVFDDADEMLDTCDLDALDIAASVDAHAPLVRAAAARGIHIMCQKPLTRTVAEARLLIEEVGERDRAEEVGRRAGRGLLEAGGAKILSDLSAGFQGTPPSPGEA